MTIRATDAKTFAAWAKDHGAALRESLRPATYDPAALRYESRRIQLLDLAYARAIMNTDRAAFCFVVGMLTGAAVVACGLLL